MKSIVVYKSKYGSSRQYAVWIAEALRCEAINVRKLDETKLADYESVIYVGGLYAGKINGFDKLRKNMELLKIKKLALCMVGLTDPAEKDKYDQVYRNQVPEAYRNTVRPFALRGDQLYSKMSFLDRILMKALMAMVRKTPPKQRGDDVKELLANYGKDVRFADKESIQGIVEFIQSGEEQ